MCLTRPLVIAILLLVPTATVAQQPDEKESAAVLELGAAGAWSLKNAASGFGPTVAVEVTPIEHWLELEGGVTPLFSRHATEWSADPLFKKPWSLSRKIEFMAGVGPEWIHTRESGMSTNSVGAEAVLDFMFWRPRKHRLGWYLEPTYEYKFRPGHEHSLGVNGGILIAIP
ncbi:MAG TPA: hypothetical protein VJN89_23555 [Candidatus Acidoferrum sp.]|nr:hypothetical protein [Candidatus Acidoferrum sp.]